MNNSIKVLLGVLGGAVLVLVLLTVFAGNGFFGRGPMMGQGGMMGGGWGFSGILWMLVPLLLLGKRRPKPCWMQTPAIRTIWTGRVTE